MTKPPVDYYLCVNGTKIGTLVPEALDIKRGENYITSQDVFYDKLYDSVDWYKLNFNEIIKDLHYELTHLRKWDGYAKTVFIWLSYNKDSNYCHVSVEYYNSSSSNLCFEYKPHHIELCEFVKNPPLHYLLELIAIAIRSKNVALYLEVKPNDL